MKLPVTFAFNSRAWNQIIVFQFGLFTIFGFLAGVIGGHPLPDIIWFTILFPACFTPLFWLLGVRSFHRSYTISEEGVTLRRREKNIEFIKWEDVREIRPWPLALMLHSGRKMSFALTSSDMRIAQEIVIKAFDESRQR